MKTASLILTILAMLFSNRISAQLTCDTFSNVRPTDTLTLYNLNVIGGFWGYVSGHNTLLNLCYADSFHNSSAVQVTGAFYHFGVAQFGNPNSTITAAIWDNTGIGGSPGNMVASETVLISSIAQDVALHAHTYVAFTNAPILLGDFYVGIKLNYVPGDTVALFTNTISSNVLTGWEQWSNTISDSSWHRYIDSWGVSIANAISPIVCSGPSCSSINCDDGSACTIDTCKNGFCFHTIIVCDDGDACNGVEWCDSLSGCVTGTPLVCDDGLLCTYDDCDSITGCSNVMPCNDADACTFDGCDALTGGCVFSPLSCNDGLACTQDNCNPVSGCSNVITCNDFDPCTYNDCNYFTGVCAFFPKPCTDYDPCTFEVCDQGIWCIPYPDSNCTDICDTMNCDDNDPITFDDCDNFNGCFHIPGICEDRDACTTNSYANGLCIFIPIICDDNISCTVDYCSGQCLFAPFSPAHEICMVGVDSATGKNIIVWEKSATSFIDSYFIYRETSQSDVYARIGAQAYGEVSTFIDQQSAPQQNANKYKVGFLDTCGESVSGITYHKTIHLATNRGTDNSWNLIWNHYEGFSYSFNTYHIYRGSTPANLTFLDSIASNNNSYWDLNPPAASAIYYQIEAVRTNVCDPSAGMGNYNASRSNIAIASTVAVEETERNGLLKMYPNPFSTSITIEMPDQADGPFELILFDITGKELFTEHDIIASSFVLKRNTVMKGISYIEIRGMKNTYRGKIIAF